MTITAIASLAKEVEEKQGVAAGALGRVLTAIKAASKESGVDFAYLVNKAAQESGFRTDVKATTSSATGLYQFTEQTWLQMVRENGAKHGLDALATKITQRADGSLTVKDRALRSQILELRKNPEMAAAMAAELAQDNKTYLQNNVGGTIGNTELYLAHFLGAGGATDFLTAMRGNPQAKAANLLPEAAAANRNVFYDANGRPKSVAAIYDQFALKMEGKGIDIPADAVAPPTMLARLGGVLDQLPNLKNVRSETTTLANAAGEGGASRSLAGGATAAALFSAMVLSQVDAFSASNLKNLPGASETSANGRHSGQNWVQVT